MTSIEQVIAETQKNGRVCPQPQRWNELYKLLPDRKRKDNGWEPALPLILGAWWDTPMLSKTIRFREHLEWADAHGVLAKVFEFMTNLPEEEWYHGE